MALKTEIKAILNTLIVMDHLGNVLLKEDEILAKILEVGIDGTDIEINRGQYGQRGLRSTPALPLHTLR